jgi:hypothetical protein
VNRIVEALIYGVVAVVAFFAVAAAFGSDVQAMIAARGARALVLSRHKLQPIPAPPRPAPRDPCCNECGGTGMWRPDKNVLVPCPCEETCPCKCKSGACATKKGAPR